MAERGNSAIEGERGSGVLPNKPMAKNKKWKISKSCTETTNNLKLNIRSLRRNLTAARKIERSPNGVGKEDGDAGR